MAERDINRELMEYTEFAIRSKIAHRPTGYVTANLYLHYEIGGRKERVAPDVFWVERAVPGRRSSYVLAEEGFVPDVVFEFVSRASVLNDFKDPEEKRRIYEQLGIPEYYAFDPLRRWLDPPLWAYRLRADGYLAIPVTSGTIDSPRLGLRLQVENDWLWFYDLRTGRKMLTADETRQRAAREAMRANRAARRAARESLRADQEAARADQEAARADQEAARNQALREELDGLRRDMERLKPGEK